LLGYQPEETVETNILQQYNTLHTRYCQDNGLQFDTSRKLESDVDMPKLSELLYQNLYEELGHESIIQIRRNITNLVDQVLNQILSDKSCVIYQRSYAQQPFLSRQPQFDQQHFQTIKRKLLFIYFLCKRLLHHDVFVTSCYETKCHSYS
jgi:hypothetical protein